MKYFLFLLLIGCATTMSPASQKSNTDHHPQYRVGDCLMVFDPTNNQPTRHRVRVEKVDISLHRYFYRWLMDSGKWDSGLSSGVGNFKTLEKITKKVNDCPLSAPVAFTERGAL